MPNITSRGIDEIYKDYPETYEALTNLVKVVNQLSVTAGISAQGAAPTPQNLTALNVTAADGIFDAQIADPAPQRGENYFLEWDEQKTFANAKTIPLGPGRAWRGTLGSRTLYWRTYKQLPGSNVSTHSYFGGSNPQGASGANSNGGRGPTPQATTGSGTSMIPGHGSGPIGQIKKQVANL